MVVAMKNRERYRNRLAIIGLVVLAIVTVAVVLLALQGPSRGGFFSPVNISGI